MLHNTEKKEFSTANTYVHNFIYERYVVERHQCHKTAKFGAFVDGDHSRLITLYCLPKFHKRPY